jgi:hypothetical protein
MGSVGDGQRAFADIVADLDVRERRSRVVVTRFEHWRTVAILVAIGAASAALWLGLPLYALYRWTR